MVQAEPGSHALPLTLLLFTLLLQPSAERLQVESLNLHVQMCDVSFITLTANREHTRVQRRICSDSMQVRSLVLTLQLNITTHVCLETHREFNDTMTHNQPTGKLKPPLVSELIGDAM